VALTDRVGGLAGHQCGRVLPNWKRTTVSVAPFRVNSPEVVRQTVVGSGAIEIAGHLHGVVGVAHIQYQCDDNQLDNHRSRGRVPVGNFIDSPRLP